jgi:two-component system chemotaxis response regulator CheY
MRWVETEFSDLKVLIVNAFPEFRTIMRGFLGDIGIYETYTADNSARALMFIPELKPDMAILDKFIRPVDGVKLTKYIRSDANSPRPDLPIVLLATFWRPDGLYEARDAGVSEVVAKPFTANALLSHVKAAMHAPRPIIATGKYIGPDRRRREDIFYFNERRRSRIRAAA